MRLFLDDAVLRPVARGPAGVGRRLRPLLPAAGLLLRHVRAGRAGAELPRPLRPDDVGPDRQQRRRRCSCWRPTCSPSARPRARRSRAASPPAPSCCWASARRWASWSSCWCWCPTCARPASASGPRFDFRGSGLGHTLRLGVWTVLFVVVNQVAYTVVVRLASRGTVGGPGGPGRRDRGHRLHDLLQLVPAHDGAALDHHGLAGDRDAPAALEVRRRGRPRRGRAGGVLDAAVGVRPGGARSRCCSR